MGTGVLLQFRGEASGVVRGAQGVDDVNGGGEADAEAGLAGGVAEGDGEMGFSQADTADQDGVALVADEAEAEEVLHGLAVDLRRPGEVELLEGLEHGEAGFPDAA